MENKFKGAWRELELQLKHFGNSEIHTAIYEQLLAIGKTRGIDRAGSEKEVNVCKKAVDTFGVKQQKLIAIEELSELIQAICHNDRGKCDVSDVCSEIADVEIMLGQLRYIYDEDGCVDESRRFKLDRLEKLIADYKTKKR